MDNRRPIAARSSRWAPAAARALSRRGVSADAISAASLVFALIAAAFLLAGGALSPLLYLGAALFVPLRLVANLLDGLVAVEGGRASPVGPLYNEVPDRLSDAVILVAAGYGAALAGPHEWAVPAGWLAALCAVLTAYVRELGRALAAPADFCGPFAKQQRMAVIVAAAALSALEPLWDGAGLVLAASVALVAAGTAATVARRLMRLAALLRGRP